MAQQGIDSPPSFCQYADGPCDQDFTGTKRATGIFLYPSSPTQIAGTIERAASEVELSESESNWLTWRRFSIAGQVIFCAICKRMRFADLIAADVSTMNLNLMFEIGFALGLGIPVIPIRDTSFVRDLTVFRELGLLDTLGFVDFRNASDLIDVFRELEQPSPVPSPPAQINLDSPLYLVKSRHNTEGELLLQSTLRRSLLDFRSYDVEETPRLSLHEARKQVASSLGVVAHLLHEDREGSLVHNARAALIAGLAMADGKTVVLLQEGEFVQPIDYRDVVQSYSRHEQMARLLERPLRQLMHRRFDRSFKASDSPQGLLHQVDLGDVAAENEIRPLRSYFVPTGQYQEALRGHARLVVGRKGSGKTAIFYSLADAFGARVSHLLLDLKPEGHQFTKLREAVLAALSPGLQEHTLTAFWNSILLTELARKIAEDETRWAHRDADRTARFERVASLHEAFGLAEEGDFSERLQRQVERLIEEFRREEPATAGSITELLFKGDLRELHEAIAGYLELKDEAWLIVDNLDKGWPTRGLSSVDVLILRTLLEATRKLQRQFARREIEFRSLVFLRNDVYEHLVKETPDRGKETAIELDWTDREVFKELVRKRIVASSELSGGFDEVWNALFEPMVGVRPSFHYMVDRTLMRPRDLLMFIRRAIEVAINRGHERVTQADIEYAEEGYSEDSLQALGFELRDVNLFAADWLYAFLRCEKRLSADAVRRLLRTVDGDRIEEAIEVLLWFGFIGVAQSGREARFSYEVRNDLRKLLTTVERDGGYFVVHPAFHRALECRD